MKSKLLVPIILLILIAACAPAASTPTASATPTATSTPAATQPTATQTPAATASVRPSGTPIALPTTAQIAAAGSGVVWAFVNGDHLFRSTDKGDSWTERTLPQGISSNARIAFTNGNEGWLLAAGTAATACSGQAVTLWRTGDGAATWTKLDTAGIDAAQCKDSVAFVDAQRGYIGAWDTNTQPKIYRTTDGGKTWSSSTLPNPPAQRPATFADFGTVVLTSEESGAAPNRYYSFRSSDAGSTWTGASAGPVEGIPIVFLSATRWLQIGAPSQSQETTDGGSTWHAFTTDYQQAAPVAPQVVFGDATTGYATVRGSIQRTTDGGAHWTAIKTPGT
jgi:photosystem II stability/assembly factor-like uncharacterized protein